MFLYILLYYSPNFKHNFMKFTIINPSPCVNYAFPTTLVLNVVFQDCACIFRYQAVEIPTRFQLKNMCLHNFHVCFYHLFK